MKDQRNVLIFKTNLERSSDVNRLALVMQQLGAIHRWSVDREDEDRVLRVETDLHGPNHIIEQLNGLGYHCEEMTD